MNSIAERLEAPGNAPPRPAAAVKNGLAALVSGPAISGPSPRGAEGELGRASSIEMARGRARLPAIDVASRFDAGPAAMNGAFALMADVVPERGRGSRATVSASHPPLDAPREVEATFEIAR